MNIDTESYIGIFVWAVIFTFVIAIRSALLSLFHVDASSEPIVNTIIWMVSLVGGVGLWFASLILLANRTNSPKRKPASLTTQVTLLADEAISRTQRDFQHELDFSEESIKFMDKVCDEIRQTGSRRMSRQAIRKYSLLWGCYVGEILRGHSGGEWVANKSGFGKVFVLRKGTIVICPVDKVRQRIISDSQESLSDYYQLYKEEFRHVYLDGGNAKEKID